MTVSDLSHIRSVLAGVTILLVGLGGAGCSKAPPINGLLLGQIPVTSSTLPQPETILDQRYPPGSRVVFVRPPYVSNAVQVLSQGLVAAGGPVLSLDRQHIFFVGKAESTAAWQIYEANWNGSQPRAMTALSGGAMDPAILANGDLVFSSPVPRIGMTWKSETPAALYAQSPNQAPRRLTFGTYAAIEPTVLRDGKILFISAHPPTEPNAKPCLGLFTVNNDGTEIAPYALDRDGAPIVHRPRELSQGKVAFLSTDTEINPNANLVESVRQARPFLSRSPLFTFPSPPCRSVEPNEEGAILACLETTNSASHSNRQSFAVYLVAPDAQVLGKPLFDDPQWNDIEAVSVMARPHPLGHISAMEPVKKYGTILCLNANFTRQSTTKDYSAAKAERIRVLARSAQGHIQTLGEVPLQPDGSFMAELPADMPIGFEALNITGQVLRRLPPSIWVRSGENHSCLGCHEPYNHTPHNARPMAVSVPCPNLCEKVPTLAHQTR